MVLSYNLCYYGSSYIWAHILFPYMKQELESENHALMFRFTLITKVIKEWK